ncbi:hypothetical protein CLOP_g24175 [Closterium sp. NIES-67]|nr:hypothetical protein CLOP_g24175 [Closterium sp. NIES-67]
MATAHSAHHFLCAIAAARSLSSPQQVCDTSLRLRASGHLRSRRLCRRSSHRQRMMPRSSSVDFTARGIEDGHSTRGAKDAFPAMSFPSELTSPLLAANGESSPPPAAAETRPFATASTTASTWTAAALPFLFPALGGLLFGYDIGATSSALLSLKDPVLSGTDWFDLSSTAVGLVVSGSLGGALLGCLLAFRIADPLGRRRELLLAAALYLCGALLTASAASLPALLAGRLMYGAAIGLAMHGAPMYIAETSPPAIRGTLISLKEAFIVAGILLGYVSGSVLIDQEGAWRAIYGLAAPLALVMAGGMAWLPPSPRWLLLRAQQEGQEEQKRGPEGQVGQAGRGGEEARRRAVQALRRLRGGACGEGEAQREVQGMLEALGEGGGSGGKSGWSELVTGASGRALVIACGLVFFQQVTGQPSVLYYAGSILQDAGFSAASDATRVSVLLGCFKLAMTGVAVATVDRWGRRPLLLAGVSGLVASLVLLGSLYAIHTTLPTLSVLSLLLFVGCYQVSFGPIAWLMVSEVFPLPVRGRAQSLATLVNFGSNALVTFALPPIQDTLGQAATFYSFATIGAGALVFIYLWVPETKGLQLEEIEAKLTAGKI